MHNEESKVRFEDIPNFVDVTVLFDVTPEICLNLFAMVNGRVS